MRQNYGCRSRDYRVRIVELWLSRPAQTMEHVMSDRHRFIETYEGDEEPDGARGPILFDVILALSFMLWIVLLMIVGVI